MTLNEFCTAFKDNEGVSIILLNIEGDAIIRFNAGGYQGVEGDILAKTVKKIKIEHSTEIKVTITDPVSGATGA